MGIRELDIRARDIKSAREEIFYILKHRGDEKFIYFHGWAGFGAAPVLRSTVQELRSIKAKNTPPELCFDRIIYIDCSVWESTRVMQRKIAEELELDLGIMAKFDKQDEEDDFDGVDHGSRDLIRSVSEAIAQDLVYKKLMMVFLNGSDDMIDVSRFGISPEYCDHVIVWTFKRQSLTIQDEDRPTEILRKQRYNHRFIRGWITNLTSSEFSALLYEEAANAVSRHPSMRGIDIAMVTECCLYELFLHHSFHRATGFDWAAHAPNYWMCDGIIKGDGTRDISDTLHQEIHWEIDSWRVGRVFENLMEDPEVPFLIIKGDGTRGISDTLHQEIHWEIDSSQVGRVFGLMEYPEVPFLIAKDDTPLLIKRSCRWISATPKNLVILNEDTNNKAILERVSSLFVAPRKSDDLSCLPKGFLQHCSNLGVLILSHCAFSFVSPPFHWCQGLRFLGLDHCTHDNTSEGENKNTDWAWLQHLWVLDLRYTEWHDILSDKFDKMTNLMELNMEGFMCWQLVNRLHGKLPYLRRLRIIKPMHKADTSIDSSNSLFVDKTELEVLDLSANRDMKNLSISSSMARTLQALILDGCDGLDNVVVADGLPSSLRSFSFDGYGPATHWTSSFKQPPKRSEQKHTSDADTSAVKTSKISLQGCTQLENLFVRGLPNLEELDLSGSTIKVLNFGTMVINVPGLKRLILLGCEHLHVIKWGTFDSVEQLELLCVDTRPWRAHGFTRPCLAEHKKSFCLELHATLADARLTRSLSRLLNHYGYGRGRNDFYFSIHVTSSSAYGGGGSQDGTTHEEMIEPSSQQHHVEVIPYGDTFFKIGGAPMLFFPQPPTQPLDRHVEISYASRGLEGELARPDRSNLAVLMRRFTESLHVHDVSTSASMPTGYWSRLKWCRVERCPNLDTVFPELGDENKLQTIWASHLLMARCIWSKGYRSPYSFGSLQHLHLCSCPRLQFVLPVWVASFPSLETLHIIYCGDLTHVLPLDNKYPEEIAVRGLPFPKLTTIHLHDLPKLQQICEVKMLAPKLETIKIRGCFALRRLPTVGARKPGVKKPDVEIEKDVWDSLEWDGLADGHHPNLFEPPVHSRYYRRSRLLRSTVLR